MPAGARGPVRGRWWHGQPERPGALPSAKPGSSGACCVQRRTRRGRGMGATRTRGARPSPRSAPTSLRRLCTTCRWTRSAGGCSQAAALPACPVQRGDACWLRIVCTLCSATGRPPCCLARPGWAGLREMAPHPAMRLAACCLPLVALHFPNPLLSSNQAHGLMSMLPLSPSHRWPTSWRCSSCSSACRRRRSRCAPARRPAASAALLVHELAALKARQ